MPRFVALLRGVNVGKAKRLPMADWRDQLQGLGFRDVATLQNSGNAVFSAAGRSAGAHAAKIHQALIDSLGLDVAVVVKSAAEWAQVVAQQPWGHDAGIDPARLLVAVAADGAAMQALAPIAALATPPDRAHLGAKALYLHCASGILASAAGKALLGPAGHAATSRNWATMLKLQALLQPAAG